MDLWYMYNMLYIGSSLWPHLLAVWDRDQVWQTLFSRLDAWAAGNVALEWVWQVALCGWGNEVPLCYSV